MAEPRVAMGRDRFYRPCACHPATSHKFWENLLCDRVACGVNYFDNQENPTECPGGRSNQHEESSYLKERGTVYDDPGKRAIRILVELSRED